MSHDRLNRYTDSWTHPKSYQFENDDQVLQAAEDLHAVVVDPIDYIAQSLHRVKHVDLKDDEKHRNAFVAGIKGEGQSYGRYFHYPWNGTLVRCAEEDDYYDMLTFSNHNIIDRFTEQPTLRALTISYIGLSVGSNIAYSNAQSGIGRHCLLFDPDYVSPENRNRIHARPDEIGLPKTTVAGRRIAEINPYIKQTHFPNGYSKTADMQRFSPNVVVEEADDLDAKLQARLDAQQMGVPLIMLGDVHDRVTISIERYDRPGTKLFNGRLTEEMINKIRTGTLTERDRTRALIGLLGIGNISSRMLKSTMLRGTEVHSYPQVGTTASVAGGVGSVAIRDIFLGYQSRSRVGKLDISSPLGSGPSENLSNRALILYNFIRHQLKQKPAGSK